jgi:hypothetical protein
MEASWESLLTACWLCVNEALRWAYKLHTPNLILIALAFITSVGGWRPVEMNQSAEHHEKRKNSHS